MAMSAEYVDDTTFRVEENVSDIFYEGRRVLCDQGSDDTSIVTVDGESSYDGTYTVVNVKESDLTDSLSAVEYGWIGPDSLPLHGGEAHKESFDQHEIAGDFHTESNLEAFNDLISDASLDGAGDKRPPDDHNNDAHEEDYVTDDEAIDAVRADEDHATETPHDFGTF